jgi:hypothetical protein
MHSACNQTLADRLRYFGGTVPHGIESNYRLHFRFLLCPSTIPSDYFVQIASPNGAMVAGDRVDLDAEVADLIQKLAYQRRKRKQNVGEVLGSFMFKNGLVTLTALKGLLMASTPDGSWYTLSLTLSD